MKFINPRLGVRRLTPPVSAAFFRWVVISSVIPAIGSAAIVYSGNENIGIPADFEGIFVNVTDPQTRVATSSAWDLNLFFGGLGIANSPSFQPVRSGTGSEDPILALALGTSVGAFSTFSTAWGGSGAEDDSGHLGPGASQFKDGQTGYLGFKLIRDQTVNYGWMRVSLTRNGGSGAILDWAYETSGAPIFSGAAVDLGTAPLFANAGTSQTLTASAAGTGVQVEAGAQITFHEGPGGGVSSGKIDGAGEIQVAGAGGLRLTGDNPFSGTVVVLAGSRLTVSEEANLGSAQIKIGPSATLVFDSLVTNDGAANTFFNPITVAGGAATLNNSGSGKVVLSGIIATNDGSLEFAGGSFEVLAGIIGAGSLHKQGAGTLTLAGASTYTGDTLVSAGVVVVNGSISSKVVVESSGTLKGRGGLGGSVDVAGRLSPGNSPGVLTVAGTTNFISGSIFEWELDTSQSTPETQRGTAYDGLNTGAVKGDGAVFKILLTGSQAFSEGFWDQDRTWTDIFKSADGNANLLGWATIFGGGFQYSSIGGTAAPTGQGYFTTSGNSLSWSAVPEPGNALVSLLVASGLLRRRRRNDRPRQQ